MRRAWLLGVLVAGGALSMTVSALSGLPEVRQQAAGGAQPMVVEVEKLKDNLYVMRGGGGNSAVFITATGVVVVDTKNPGWGQPLLEKIRSVTDKPVTTIVNTHTHGDHVSGNVDFPATVEVVTHVNTAANMKEMRPAIGSSNPPRNIFKEHNGHGMPKRTFTDRMTLGSGSDRIELRHFGRGHTNGDAWVLFPALRIVHAGDIFSGKNIPLIDSNNGGSAVEIGNTLDNAATAYSGQVDGIITGHSTVMTVADLREYAQFNRDFLADAQAAKKAGRTVDEAAKAWKIPAKYVGYAAPAEARLRTNVQIAFDETR